MEQQYQDAVRRGIGDLYLAYVDVLAARRTVYYARVNAQGTDEFLRKHRGPVPEETRWSSADVEQARSESAVAAVSLVDAEEMLSQGEAGPGRHAQPTAGVRRPPRTARLAGGTRVRPCRPTTSCSTSRCNAGPTSSRSGWAWRRAQAAYQLARANRFADAYLLYQPFTFQNNAPFGTQSATSWALGITVPLPVYNRNQGNIERARINIRQSEVQLNDRERQVITEVQQALGEYDVTGRMVVEIRDRILPALKRAIAHGRTLFREGEVDVFRLHEPDSGPTTTGPRPIST